MATTYLSKTLGTPTNNIKWTWSTWIKRSKITGSAQRIFYAENGAGSNYTTIQFDDEQYLVWFNENGGTDMQLKTSRQFRDTNAWMNLVFVYDSANATAADRQIIYVNGERQTAFLDENTAGSSVTTAINQAVVHNIASGPGAANFYDGSMSQIHFIDGTAYPATAFGSVNATSGIWVANTSPTVTYGNNGFFLDMANSSDMGNDVSGNANDFTVGGGTVTQMEDTPDNNFATLNPLNNTQGATLSNGNTKAVNLQNDKYYTSTIAMSSGKYYWEVKPTTIGNRNGVGVTNVSRNFNSNSLSGTNYGYIQLGNNTAETNGTHTGTVPTISNDNIVCYAFDSSTNILYYSVDANLNTASANKFTLASDEYIIFCKEDGGTVGTNEFNFGNGYFGTTAVSSAGTNASGNGIFEYDTPTGYTALSTKGLNL
jgi:hypothetical protein